MEVTKHDKRSRVRKWTQGGVAERSFVYTFCRNSKVSAWMQFGAKVLDGERTAQREVGPRRLVC